MADLGRTVQRAHDGVELGGVEAEQRRQHKLGRPAQLDIARVGRPLDELAWRLAHLGRVAQHQVGQVLQPHQLNWIWIRFRWRINHKQYWLAQPVHYDWYFSTYVRKVRLSDVQKG